jgi:hypothetical protein
MSSNNPYDAMDREELVKLAGEQALLKQDMQRLNAENNRDITALRNLPNDISHSKDWHARGVELLDRIRDRQQQTGEGYRRLQELAKLTGIN